jgi:NAD(P)-dependent dehydrogenase (short-subunit alcohol dehydrogenase family)
VQDVLVVTGCGGMGTAVARRLGSGQRVLLADVDEGALDAAAAALRAEGLEVTTCTIDVERLESVTQLAETAAALGRIGTVVHTAGLSPVQASPAAIVRVDLVGTALMLDVFGRTIASGGSGVFVASMAGAMATLGPDLERRLATTPAADLSGLPELSDEALGDAAAAYVTAKRANQLRVRAAATTWGARGARVNSVSPGVIATPMGAAELAGPTGAVMRQMITDSPAGRIGTPHDIAGAVAFLSGHEAGFVTGTDLLVDGGAVAALFG